MRTYKDHLLAVVIVLLVTTPLLASAQVQINDNINMNFGLGATDYCWGGCPTNTMVYATWLPMLLVSLFCIANFIMYIRKKSSATRTIRLALWSSWLVVMSVAASAVARADQAYYQGNHATEKFTDLGNIGIWVFGTGAIFAIITGFFSLIYQRESAISQAARKTSYILFGLSLGLLIIATLLGMFVPADWASLNYI